MSSQGPISITITTGTVLTFVGAGLAVWLFFYLKELVLVILTAVVLSSAVEPGVQWFMKRGSSRVIAVAAIFAIILGSIFAVAYAFFPPLLKETASFSSDLPRYLEAINVDDLLNSSIAESARAVSEGIPTIEEYLSSLQSVFTATSAGAFKALAGIFGGLVSLVLIIVLSIYFAIQETGVDDFLRVILPVEHQKYALDLWKRSQVKIGLWMQGQLLLSLLAGVLTYLWLAILGVPYAFLLAIFAAMAELVPVFGTYVAAAPAVAIGFAFGGVPLALAVIGGFIVINQFQSHLVYPLVVKKVVGVPPLLVIIALIAGHQLAGFLGVLLSVPLSAALAEFVSDVQKSKERAFARLVKSGE
ncbi:AI-2E family transporter [Patescibacteria group bacterium]|nr:AI-2E family transporter [Patescibacteria group bacterium]